jgi:hypothetical protein
LREQLSLTQVFEGIEEAVGEARAGEAWERIYNTPGKDYRTQEAEHNEECEAGAEAEQAVQAALLRDLHGNPFRPLPPKRGRKKWERMWRSLLAWNDGTVVKLVQAIYDERAFDRLPILADALEESGCSDAEILSHCRGAGPHVRGCWLVDLILGKE